MEIVIFFIIFIFSVIVSTHIVSYIFKPLIKPNLDNSWALITGATEGLGLAFAKRLAELKYNLIILSRNNAKLEIVSKNIKEEYNVDVIPYRIDLSEPFNPEYLYNFEDLNVKIIVNNVGISYNPRKLEDVKFWEKLLYCNIHSVVNITKFFLKTREKITFINVSSVLSEIPGPYLSLYSASKAFVNKFTEDLKLEYPKNRFYTIKPWFLATKMSNQEFSDSSFVPEPYFYLYFILDNTYYFPHLMLDILFKTGLKLPIVSNIITNRIRNYFYLKIK